MKDLLAWYGLKRYPFDKEIKTSHLLQTDASKECEARLDYMKRVQIALVSCGFLYYFSELR